MTFKSGWQITNICNILIFRYKYVTVCKAVQNMSECMKYNIQFLELNCNFWLIL